jgi:hypothetical protein
MLGNAEHLVRPHAVIAGVGLQERATCKSGQIGLHHVVSVAERQAS